MRCGCRIDGTNQLLQKGNIKLGAFTSSCLWLSVSEGRWKPLTGGPDLLRSLIHFLSTTSKNLAHHRFSSRLQHSEIRRNCTEGKGGPVYTKVVKERAMAFEDP